MHRLVACNRVFGLTLFLLITCLLIGRAEYSFDLTDRALTGGGKGERTQECCEHAHSNKRSFHCVEVFVMVLKILFLCFGVRVVSGLRILGADF